MLEIHVTSLNAYWESLGRPGPGQGCLDPGFVRCAIRKATGIDPVWEDEQEGNWHTVPIGGLLDIHHLRRYAALIDFENERVEDSDVPWSEGELLRKSRGDCETPFLHLICHGFDSGLYLPIDFDVPLIVPDWRPHAHLSEEDVLSMTYHEDERTNLQMKQLALVTLAIHHAYPDNQHALTIGSSVRLLIELSSIAERIEADLHRLDFLPDEHTLIKAQVVCGALREAARISISEGLPMILDG